MRLETSMPFIALLCLAACDVGGDDEPAASSAPSNPLALEARSEAANGALPAFSIKLPAGLVGSATRKSTSFSSEIEWEAKGGKLPTLAVKAFPPPQATKHALTLDLQTGSCAKAKGTILSDSRDGARRTVVCKAKVYERGGVGKEETRVMVSWMEGKNFMLCRAMQRGKADPAYLESICDSLELKEA